MNKKSLKGAVGATGVGAGLGAVVGSGIGIAGAFGAISGVVPLAAIGGYLGLKAYKALSENGTSTNRKEEPLAANVKDVTDIEQTRLAPGEPSQMK